MDTQTNAKQPVIQQQLLHEDIGSYGKESHGCFNASEALGRFFGFTSRRYITNSMNP
jgi:hypothetical protein